jgi:hypothetical protein
MFRNKLRDRSNRQSSSNSYKREFRVRCANNTKKEEDERSELSYSSVSREKKLKMYQQRAELGLHTMKNLQRLSKNMPHGSNISRGNTSRSHIS